jgi:hypothetical protein
VAQADYCGVCGWPLQGAAACEACEAPAGSDVGAGQDESHLWILGGPRPEDYPDLKNAFLAWKQKDWTRMVGQCLVALGLDAPQITNLPDGPGWTFVHDSAAVYMSLDKARGELAVESPMVRLPARQRVPLMRTLLELNQSSLGAARFCLRGELVVLRFADQVENLAPPKLVAAIRSVAVHADQLDNLLSLTFAAPRVGPEAQRQRLSWQVLGSARRLKHLAGADALPLASVTAAPGPPPGPPPAAAREGGPAVPGTVLDGVETQLRSADALCALLTTALDLSKPLEFMPDLPMAVPLLLQRALLFRAFDQFRESCPDAVGMLLHHGEPVYAQFWEAPVGLVAKMGSAITGVPMPTPVALQIVVEHVVKARAQVGRQALPAPSPFASAAEAKTVGRKYVAEIEKGPKDAGHRHFVLLGAFAELLTRARLPEPTAARVRQLMKEGGALGPGPAGAAFLLDKLKGIVA